MTKIIELRQDRNLICNNFNGYKLSLDGIPILRQDLVTSPYKAEPNEEQYSLLHAELFSMQNLLQVDPWSRTTTYYVNRLGEVIRCAYSENTGRPEALQVVFSFSGADDDAKKTQLRVKGDYNYSMRFISEKYCVLCNGLRQLFLLDTGDRMKVAEWVEIAKTHIFADGEEQDDENMRNYLLYDCRLDIIQEQKQISLALGIVQRVDAVADRGSSHYLHLHWAKWILTDQWQFSILDTLEGKGSLYYCAFEPRAESLVISSNREFKFCSQNKTEVTNCMVEAQEKPQLHEENKEIDGFTWTQADDDILIKFNVKANKEKSDYNVKCTAQQLTVKCADETLLDNELFAKVDKDLTTWTMENNFIQITLVKEVSPLSWPSLLRDGGGPIEYSESGVSQICIPPEQQPIANLEAPIEDCDFPIGITEDDIKIVRIHLPTKTITHTVLLGSNPPLFATSLRAGFPPALATRQDVDACLWLQQYNPSKPNEWSLRHEGNLHAFGYVQASKQQKKFIDCSPDLNYAVICESHRHIFLYKSNYDGANGLRNRSGPQVTIGKQHLIALEDAGEVLGIATASSVITLLTEKCILYLQIN